MLYQAVTLTMTLSDPNHPKPPIFLPRERVVNVWNCLSPEMIDFSSLASFRRSLEATDLGALTY